MKELQDARTLATAIENEFRIASEKAAKDIAARDREICSLKKALSAAREEGSTDVVRADGEMNLPKDDDIEMTLPEDVDM